MKKSKLEKIIREETEKVIKEGLSDFVHAGADALAGERPDTYITNFLYEWLPAMLEQGSADRADLEDLEAVLRENPDWSPVNRFTDERPKLAKQKNLGSRGLAERSRRKANKLARQKK